MHSDWELYARGADAAEDLLRRIYGVDVRKSLNPLKLRDFERIVRSLALSLKGQVVPVEDAALKGALGKLDARWTDMGPEARAKLIGEAAHYLGPPLVAQVLPKIDQTLAFAAKDIVPATKKNTVLTYDLRVSPDLNATDDRIANYVRVSQGHFIRNKYGARMDSFAGQARDIVASGLEKGLGSADIADDLYGELSGHAGRGLPYWNVIAMVFANRARTMTQLASYDEAGIEAYVWESVLDEATSDVCRFMHGRRFPVAHAMRRFQEVEDADSPGAIKTLQPFVSVGRDGEHDALVYGRGEDRRIVAHVAESGAGRRDQVGSYANAMSDEALADAGVSTPPIHGNCRSTIIPEFGEPSSSPVPPPPSLQPQPPSKPTSGEKKAAALEQLELATLHGEVQFGEAVGMYATDVQPAFFEHPLFDLPGEELAQQWIANAEPKKPKLESLVATKTDCDAGLVAKYIQNAKALAAAPKPKVVQYNEDLFILKGHEQLLAQKLLGQKVAHCDVLNLDKPLKSIEAPVAVHDPLNDPHNAVVWGKDPLHDGKVLNGVPLGPAQPGFWEKVPDKDVSEPALPETMKMSAGCVVVEPDGRIWVVEPKDHYGGYEHTFPKGTLETGLSTQQNALKELYEEAGIRGEITGYLGDYKGDTGTTRYYIAHRTGGAPWEAHWESQKVKLIPVSQAEAMLNKARDKKVLADFIKLQGQPKPAGQPTPPPLAIAPALAAPSATPTDAVVLGRRIGEQAGSNPGGLYRGTDGVLRYVKFYRDPLQAHTEHLANEIYNSLGHTAPESFTFEHEGKLAYASKIIEGVKTLGDIELTPAIAQKAMQGFGADVLTANWDAAGYSLDNMVLTPAGEVARIDNGGSLLLRAQGARKPEKELNKIGEWESFLTTNESYQKLAAKAGIKKAEQMRGMLIPEIQKIVDLRAAYGGWSGYVEQVAGGIESADKARIVKMLEKRTDLLRAKLDELKLLPQPSAKKLLPKGANFRAPSGRRTPVPARDVDNLEVRELADAPQRDLPYNLNTPPGGEDILEYQAKVHKKIEVINDDIREDIKQFTDGIYGPIRAAQSLSRAAYVELGENEGWSTKYEVAKKRGDQIEAAFGQVQSQPGQIFRALRNVPKETIDALMATDEVNLLGTASCSRTAAVSIDDFMGGTRGTANRVLFVIHQRSAIGVETISYAPRENELLLSKRARFKVLSRHRATENEHCLIIEVDEIDGRVPIVKWLGAVRRALAMMKKSDKDHGVPYLLPDNWPKYGELDGKQVDLAEAVRTMAPLTLACVIVDVPGIGRYQPFKGSEIVVTSDGKVFI